MLAITACWNRVSIRSGGALADAILLARDAKQAGEPFPRRRLTALLVEADKQAAKARTGLAELIGTLSKL